MRKYTQVVLTEYTTNDGKPSAFGTSGKTNSL